MTEQENKHHSEHTNADDEHLTDISEKQNEVISSKLDEAERQHYERQSEQEALAKAAELAENADGKKEKQPLVSRTERRHGAPSKKQLSGSFKSQMSDVQAEMGPGSQLISKLIHIKAIEKISDTVGSTIARPNALLSGSIAAFVTITALYFIARYNGYKLSGFETIAAFSVGWAFGIIYDCLSSLFRGRKS